MNWVIKLYFNLLSKDIKYKNGSTSNFLLKKSVNNLIPKLKDTIFFFLKKSLYAEKFNIY